LLHIIDVNIYEEFFYQVKIKLYTQRNILLVQDVFGKNQENKDLCLLLSTIKKKDDYLTLASN